jgi:hypothetical protein
VPLHSLRFRGTILKLDSGATAEAPAGLGRKVRVPLRVLRIRERQSQIARAVAPEE